jgi:hypothetical protein
MSEGLTVHVRINDAATGQPTPVRIRFEAQGRSFTPFGRLDTFPTASGVDVGGHLQLGSKKFYYIDGTCEVRLPAGAVTVEATKGPEYVPLQKVVSLAPGQISLRLAIERHTDLRARGWYSGDTHVLCLEPFAALLEGAAEDVAVVNVLAHEHLSAAAPGQPSLPNILDFSGPVPALEQSGHLVAVNTLNVHPVLGTLGLLNCHRAVYPLRAGDEVDDWTLADWCDQCHRKMTGLVVWSDTGPQAERLRSEALADLILGKIDAFELTSLPPTDSIVPSVPRDLRRWHRLLDAGLRVPLVGGSGKDSNAVALGRVRTYAQLVEGNPFNYANWIEAVRAGRTFVTNGPLLNFSVDGQGPGAVLKTSARQRLHLRAEATSTVPFGGISLWVNDAVVASARSSGEGTSAVVEVDWRAKRSTWIAARCRSHAQSPGRIVFAQASPVYVEVEGRPFKPRQAVVHLLAAHLEHMADWVRTAARCPTEHQRENLLSVFTAALERLRGNTNPA